MIKTRDEYLEQPFLDYKGVISVLGGVCQKDKAYELIKKLLKEKDENGNLLIDPDRIPDVGKLLIPTDVFCRRYGIKRIKKKAPVSNH